MLVGEPCFRRGITFAILSWDGNTANENEAFIRWCKGVRICLETDLIKCVDRPLKSCVYLSLRDLITSEISVRVTGESDRLNRGMSSFNTGSGGLSVGGISSTISLAALIKKFIERLSD